MIVLLLLLIGVAVLVWKWEKWTPWVIEKWEAWKDRDKFKPENEVTSTRDYRQEYHMGMVYQMAIWEVPDGMSIEAFLQIEGPLNTKPIYNRKSYKKHDSAFESLWLAWRRSEGRYLLRFRGYDQDKKRYSEPLQSEVLVHENGNVVRVNMEVTL